VCKTSTSLLLQHAAPGTQRRGSNPTFSIFEEWVFRKNVRMTCEGQWYDFIHFDFMEKVTLTANEFGKILSVKRLKRFESAL